MENTWQDKLRDKMSDYAEPEPEGLWEDIMARMDTLPEIPSAPGDKSRTVKQFARWTTAVAAAAIAIFAIFFPENKNLAVPQTEIIAETTDSRSEQKAADTGNRLEILHKATGTGQEILLAEAEPETGTAMCVIPDTAPMPEKTDLDLSCTETPEREREIERERKESKEQKQPAKTSYSTLGSMENLPPERPAKRRRVKRLGADISFSNLTGTNRSIPGFGTPQPSAVSFAGIPSVEGMSGTPGTGVMLLSRSAKSNVKTKHRQPIRAGVTFRYNFTDRWGIETGIVYSYLASEMISGDNDYSMKTRQSLHYIGVPVKANYNILHRRYFTLYANAGGMIEKRIRGNAEAEYTLNGNAVPEKKRKIEEKPWQWSVSAGVGAQIDFTPFLGLYIEPGASFHFDDEGMISTVYKERPLNFNFEFGLRFSFE